MTTSIQFFSFRSLFHNALSVQIKDSPLSGKRSTLLVNLTKTYDEDEILCILKESLCTHYGRSLEFDFGCFPKRFAFSRKVCSTLRNSKRYLLGILCRNRIKCAGLLFKISCNFRFLLTVLCLHLISLNNKVHV